MVSDAPKPLYDGSGGHLALDLANTVDRVVGAPGVDRLTSYGDLLRWSVDAGSLSSSTAKRLERTAASRPSEAAAVLERARLLREAAFRTLESLAVGTTPRPADLEAINAEVAAALSHARVEPAESGYAWGWERAASALESPLWPLARAIAELLTGPDRVHVKQCAATSCLWLFLDRTRNHARRWCDMKVCGNRAKVRKHRLKTRTPRS